MTPDTACKLRTLLYYEECYWCVLTYCKRSLIDSCPKNLSGSGEVDSADTFRTSLQILPKGKHLSIPIPRPPPPPPELRQKAETIPPLHTAGLSLEQREVRLEYDYDVFKKMIGVSEYTGVKNNSKIPYFCKTCFSKF